MGLIQQNLLPLETAAPEVAAIAPAIRVLPPPAAAPAPAAPKAKAGGLNLGALKASGPAKPKGKTYPVAELTDPQRDLVSRLLAEKDEYKALEGSIAALTSELLALVTPQYLRACSGLGDAPSSMIAPSVDGKEAMIVHTSRYKGAANMECVEAIIGAALAAEHFSEATTVKIDFEKIPEDKRQVVIDGLLAVATEHGCAEAIDAKQSVIPKASFHGLRHSRLTVEQNIALQGVSAMVCQVKAR